MNSPTSPLPSPRVARFERLAYGMFIHWGLYSQLGQGEWIQHLGKIPNSEYYKLKETFDAKDFDARTIAHLARDAGMRYITLTSRHHDGFSLYDTHGLSNFDAPNSKAGRDLIAEFIQACREEGIIPFLYHTTLDWRWESATCPEDKFSDYLDYLHASVELLCRHYGEIGGFWFDGNWSRQADWKEDRLYATIRKYQPEAMIINNTGLGAKGALGHPEIDSTTFEQGLPAMPDRRGWIKYVALEMCQTMNSHWGLGAQDFSYMAPSQIIKNLCACRKVGANYLLNVGPTAAGAIPAYEAAMLRRVGEWVRNCAPALYEGRPSRIAATGEDFVLETEDSIFYFAYNLGSIGDSQVTTDNRSTGPRAASGVHRPLSQIRWLDSGENMEFVQNIASGLVAINCSGYPYGTNLIVRVARGG